MAHAAPGDLVTMLATAVALGSDAMSLGVGLGMYRLTRTEISKVSFTIGLFHVLMPLAGMAIGIYLHRLLGEVAAVLGAILLIGLGVHMISDAWRGEEKTLFRLNKTAGWGLLLFAMSVSIDALSVGFSFGLSDTNLGLSVALFGIVGGLMAAIGLSIGSMVGRVLGESMEILGGAILILFGIFFLI
ncbi:manganese efflux pump MntP family protein [Effusibacillus lacus]|uniref:Putative manganese efflux pump MntP n=1 Tax=Effusibacillus lacus TaxID=1348429 RepID=A0A292YLF1_9BACL|nr:manganese efflux pump MntP family protein [Effusibacillus lacus]TCS71840.1 putative Mn2+ efflux pump MntP [Effusibacillus lacus]GAX89593.1 hypothetical protein EFBL_1217 [Effusibacillus lacus]